MKDDLIETLLIAGENWRKFLDEEFQGTVDNMIEESKPAHAWDIAVVSQPHCSDNILRTIYRMMPRDVWNNCFVYLTGKDASNAALSCKFFRYNFPHKHSHHQVISLEFETSAQSKDFGKKANYFPELLLPKSKEIRSYWRSYRRWTRPN